MRFGWLLLFLAFSCSSESNVTDTGTQDGKDAGVSQQNIRAAVVIDGDTIIVSASSTIRTPDSKVMDQETIRLIGIDAPEIEHPPEPEECWGEESKSYLESIAEGRMITLTYNHPNYRGNFGRLLAYISLAVDPDNVLNEDLLKKGHAEILYGFSHPKFNEYRDLERDAKSADLGMWSSACP